MKSDIETGVNKLVYPYLATNDNNTIIIMFSSHNCGTVVHASGAYPLGYYSVLWNEPAFKPYIGKVTLSN